MKRILLRSGAVVLALVVVLLVGVRLVYGGGEPYPDQRTPPLVPADEVEVLAELDWPPGNVTASAEGRIFFNTHPFVQSQRFADAFLFELVDGRPRPYPSAELQPDLQWVFGMTVDRQGRLWVISPASNSVSLLTGAKVPTKPLVEALKPPVTPGPPVRVTT